jgi:hypothetical protein
MLIIILFRFEKVKRIFWQCKDSRLSIRIKRETTFSCNKTLPFTVKFSTFLASSSQTSKKVPKLQMERGRATFLTFYAIISLWHKIACFNFTRSWTWHNIAFFNFTRAWTWHNIAFFNFTRAWTWHNIAFFNFKRALTFRPWNGLPQNIANIIPKAIRDNKFRE